MGYIFNATISPENYSMARLLLLGIIERKKQVSWLQQVPARVNLWHFLHGVRLIAEGNIDPGI